MKNPSDDDQKRLVSPNKGIGDDASGSLKARRDGPGLRPTNLADFIGQKHLRDNLRIFIDAARARSSHMDHVLLSGPPGLGKTTLARIIANESGANFHSTSGPVISKAGDLAAILTAMEAGDVLFIDEIHRLNPAVEELLYPAIEDFQLDILIGSGPSARSVKIDLVPFTLVGATTRSGLVTRPLRERFGIPLSLLFYEDDDLQVILQHFAEFRAPSRSGSAPDLSPRGSYEIARRSRGTPRIALRLLRRVMDFALAEKESVITSDFADRSLQRLGVDRRGFDIMDRQYLTTLADNYNGGPVGVETLCAILCEQRDVIEDVVEPFLLRDGVIQRSKRGRMLSDKGWTYLERRSGRKRREKDQNSLSLDD